MTLRLVLGSDDLGRIRIADGPDPMWEVVLSLHQVRNRSLQERYRPWWRAVDRRLRQDREAVEGLSLLRTLVPPKGGFADFLTPSSPTPDWEVGREAIACLPRDRIRADLAATFTDQSVPGW